MNKIFFLTAVVFLSLVFAGFAADLPSTNAVMAPVVNESVPPQDLNQFIYSYGTVIKVTTSDVVVQEYDYDSDVEKEVTYQIDATTRLDGVKKATELLADDVVEVYYLDQDGKKVAKIIRKEAAEDENAEPEPTAQTNT